MFENFTKAKLPFNSFLKLKVAKAFFSKDKSGISLDNFLYHDIQKNVLLLPSVIGSADCFYGRLIKNCRGFFAQYIDKRGIIFMIFFLSIISCTGHKFGDPHKDLVKITESEYNIVFDIRYATANNFTGKQIYQRPFPVFVHRNIANNLRLAAKRALELGYRLKIYDAWRPYEAQQEIIIASSGCSCSDSYDHSSGAAIDVTIVDQVTNKELDMGTSFNVFGVAANHKNENITKEVLKNRIILLGIMTSAGFRPLDLAWWHYYIPQKHLQYKGRDLSIGIVKTDR
jgi:D-alanyl-D-alanine dipeptidase